jgi:hypothetical protein
MHQYNVGTPPEMIAIDVARSFPRRGQGNHYFLVVIYSLTKRPDANTIPDHESSTELVANFSTTSEYRGSYVVTRTPVWCRRFWNSGEWTRRVSHPCNRTGGYCRALHENSQGARTKTPIALKGLGLKIYHHPPCLHGITTGFTTSSLMFGRELGLHYDRITHQM